MRELPGEIFVDICAVNGEWYGLDEDEKTDAVSDYLADEYEYCIDGYNWEVVGIKIRIYNIIWDTTD